MPKELIKALEDAFEFRRIDTEAISRIDANVGFIWFKANGNTYCIDIKKVEFNLDEYSRS